MMGDKFRTVHVNGQHQRQQCEKRRITWTNNHGNFSGRNDGEVWLEEWWSEGDPTPCDCENPQ